MSCPPVQLLSCYFKVAVAFYGNPIWLKIRVLALYSGMKL